MVLDLSKLVETEVKLNPNKTGKGLRKGVDKEEVNGYAFYQVRETKGNLTYDFITVEIRDEPVLEAIGEDQFSRWTSYKIMALPVRFVWYGYKGMWTIENKEKNKTKKT